jgi:hypothetical protein
MKSITEADFEKIWQDSNKMNEEQNEQWDSLSLEERRKLLSDPFYQRMRYEFEDRDEIDIYEDLGNIEENNLSYRNDKIIKRILFKECVVAGVGFREVDWDELYEGVKLVLVRHRDNKYDKNAVAIVLADDYDEKDDDFDFDFILGYIPRTENVEIAKMLDMGWGEMFECEISRVKRYGPINERVRIAIYVKGKNEKVKIDTRHLLRVKDLSRMEYAELIADLEHNGVVHFYFGGYPQWWINSPKEGEKIVFLHKRKSDTILYLMYTIAIGNVAASHFLNKKIEIKADYSSFVFTNVRGPIVVSHSDVEFLKLERMDFSQPEHFVSELASSKLWELFDSV